MRAVGAVGAVAAMVIGGAVTTAGAIGDGGDGSGAAEPATVQLMQTDATGQWFSCDVEVDLGPGDGAVVAFTAQAAGGGAGGASLSVMGGPTGDPVPAGEAPVAVAGTVTLAEPVTAPDGAVPTAAPEGAVPSAAPEGAVLVTAGQLPALPAPDEVRPGTADECSGVGAGVTVAPAGIPTGPGPGIVAGGADQAED